MQWDRPKAVQPHSSEKRNPSHPIALTAPVAAANSRGACELPRESGTGVLVGIDNLGLAGNSGLPLRTRFCSLMVISPDSVFIDSVLFSLPDSLHELQLLFPDFCYFPFPHCLRLPVFRQHTSPHKLSETLTNTPVDYIP